MPSGVRAGFVRGYQIEKSRAHHQMGVDIARTRVGAKLEDPHDPAIGEERAKSALLGKAAYARSSGLNLYFATQFGFDNDAVPRWEAETTAAGVTQPIHVGMPGPASLRQLAKFALVCGIGSSARMLTTRTGAMGASSSRRPRLGELTRRLGDRS